MGRNYALHRGCGWVLIVVGIMAMLFAIFLAVALWQADEEAGVKNDADWEAYPHQSSVRVASPPSSAY